jgi:hypothetical protein
MIFCTNYSSYLGLFLTTELFLNHSGFLDHIQLTHTVGLLWTSDQPVAEASTYTVQHNIETQETNIHALSGIRTRDPSNQAAADLRLRPRDHRGRPVLIIFLSNLLQCIAGCFKKLNPRLRKLEHESRQFYFRINRGTSRETCLRRRRGGYAVLFVRIGLH